jgi:hypothetical protein
MPEESIGWIFPVFMLAAASPERAALGKFFVNPYNVPAILVSAPFIPAAFRHPDVGTGTSPGLAAWQWQPGSFVEAEAPASEMTNGGTLPWLDPDSRVVPAASVSATHRFCHVSLPIAWFL